jgi:hypothetical protein
MVKAPDLIMARDCFLALLGNDRLIGDIDLSYEYLAEVAALAFSAAQVWAQVAQQNADARSTK